MKFGAHLSAAGGLDGLIEQAEALDADAIQMFARNPRGRGERYISAEAAKAFRTELKRRGWTLVIHAPYYVNIGSGVDRNRRIAVEVAAADLEKADFIGAQYVVVHLGTPGDGHDLADCTPLAIKAVKDVLKKTPKVKAKLLLEGGAGPRRVGGTFEQLRDILKGVGSRRVGICLDTAHMFLAGYDIRGRGMRKILDEFDARVGFGRLQVIHVNDTKSKLGSGWDRHWHLGKGEIGQETFRVLMRDKRLKDLPFILETPKEDKAGGMKNPDRINLGLLRRLAK